VRSVSLPIEGLTLDRLLQEAGQGDVVYLTANGEVRFALVPVDDGEDEIQAMRSNSELMAYLTECAERAKNRPRKPLREVRDRYGSPPAESKSPGEGG
jgi:antitoxin (DNA-binding transcriptional repressor) of toxin-antitoxin stability system